MVKTILLFLFLFVPTLAQVKLVPHKITLKNGKAFNLNLPAEYEILPAAEGLKRVRFFAKSPDGRIFVTDMYDLTDNAKGAVYILDEFDAETRKFGKITTYLTNLKNPNSVQFYKDEKGQDWLYLAETDRLTRRKFTKGETAPTDTKPQILATFPDYGLSYKYGGWHLTRTIAFSPAGKLYVSVGSSCNACQEKEAVRASVLEMNADGSQQRTFAKGLRNAVDLKWIGKFLFATNQGADHLGLNKPDETFYALKDGADYGWASCYQSNGKVYADSEHRRREGCENVPASYAYFPAHSSALGFDFFDETTNDESIKNSFLVALHGSTNKKVGSGYKIVIMRKGEENQDFINGFLQDKTVFGRPCGIMKLDENSFLFTDDFSGVIYYVRKKDSTTKVAHAPEAQENLVENIENANAKQPESTPKSGNCFGVAAVLFGICLRLIF
ncbi:MAG: PQQ-dependent sugar dehydrogenase [Acidobacteria bacterium]|nr:PQQ-dependent sugar dehydrogenase [Acidobacteriota bacterium]